MIAFSAVALAMRIHCILTHVTAAMRQNAIQMIDVSDMLQQYNVFC